jgi:hypothetical protein
MIGAARLAWIAGRGFKVRREDMRRLLQATEGKVFTLTSMHLLIEQAAHPKVPDVMRRKARPTRGDASGVIL